jgi:GT2 family glycosyltransferase
MNPHIVIPLYMRNEDELAMVWRCVETIRSSAGNGPVIHLVDDRSSYEPGREFLQEQFEAQRQPLMVTLKEENEGFARTANFGLRFALENGFDAVLVNADMEFKWSGWLDALYGAEADVAGGLLLYPNGLIQHAGVYFSVVTQFFDHIYRFAPGDLPAAQKPRVCPVTAALQLIRHATLERIGLYDEGFPMGWEDVDYCLRVFSDGGKCIYTPDAKAMHHESHSHSDNDVVKQRRRESLKRLGRKHAGRDLSFMPTMIGAA